jgi:hypothetical protein
MGRASEPGGGALGRRAFLAGAAAALLWPRGALGVEAAEAPAPRAELPEATRRLLEQSRFVYVSPLRSSGAESTCHGEVWFGWLDGTVVVNARRLTWKVKALRAGLDRARIWVGDHGRWKQGLTGRTRNEAFRSAPSFDARARFESERAVLDRLLALYEEKYAGEFGRWREDMRTGFYAGQRLLIRYEPI